MTKADPPTHIARHGAVDRTLCGIRLKDQAALPYLHAAHVQSHVQGYGVRLCEDCRVSYDWLVSEVDSVR